MTPPMTPGQSKASFGKSKRRNHTMTRELNVAHPALGTFLGQLGGVAVSAPDPVSRIRRIIDPFRHLLMENFLPDEYREAPNGGISRWIIYRSSDRSLSLVVTTAAPRVKTPVHDHGASWGLKGMYQGAERETAYAPPPEADPAGNAIKRTKRRRLKAGDVTAIMPPDMDIHSIEVMSAMPAVSLMLLASGPGLPQRHVYDVRRHTRELNNDHYEDRY